LFDQTAERDDPGGRLGPSHRFGPVDVVRGQIGEGASAFVLVLDAHQPGLGGREARMATTTGLDAGLLVSAYDELALSQRRTLEDPGIQVQCHCRFGREPGVSGEDPHAVLPWPDGVTGQDPGHCGGRNGRDHVTLDQFSG
jgi:hypothetical protein